MNIKTNQDYTKICKKERKCAQEDDGTKMYVHEIQKAKTNFLHNDITIFTSVF
jgi:hypothetical protein